MSDQSYKASDLISEIVSHLYFFLFAVKHLFYFIKVI